MGLKNESGAQILYSMRLKSSYSFTKSVQKMEKGKTIAMILLLIMSLQVLVALSASAKSKNIVMITYLFNESEILAWLDGGKPMSNLRVQARAGEPLAPYKEARILLPPSSEVADISVQPASNAQHIVNDIPCGHPGYALDEEPIIMERDPGIYGSDGLYPRKAYEVGSVESFQGYNILRVRLYPV